MSIAYNARRHPQFTPHGHSPPASTSTGSEGTGLIDQLIFNGFSDADAAWGVDSLNVDWFAQAALKAESYLKVTAFSRSGLVDQLMFNGFTPEQAESGVTRAGL